jgi:hypothetical protein
VNIRSEDGNRKLEKLEMKIGSNDGECRLAVREGEGRWRVKIGSENEK